MAVCPDIPVHDIPVHDIPVPDGRSRLRPSACMLDSLRPQERPGQPVSREAMIRLARPARTRSGGLIPCILARSGRPREHLARGRAGSGARGQALS